jgi:PPM family protein phosphatase
MHSRMPHRSALPVVASSNPNLNKMTEDARDISTVLFTAAGGSRNEDRACVLMPNWGTIMCVADGAGGSGGGERAAQVAIDTVSVAVRETSSPFTSARLSGVLEEIDAQLFRGGVGETTCVTVQIVGSAIIGVSVGDSSALVVRDEDIQELTDGQVRKPLLGSGEAVVVEFAPHELHGLLVVATDGLTKYIARAALLQADAASDLERARDILVESARLRSGAFQDDITFVLGRFAKRQNPARRTTSG